MPRLVMTFVSGSAACTHLSLPEAASSAMIELFRANTYIVPSTTTGLKKYLLLSPVGNVQAISSLVTVERFTCASDEY